MIIATVPKKWLDVNKVIIKILLSFKKVVTNVILTYFVINIAEKLYHK